MESEGTDVQRSGISNEELKLTEYELKDGGDFCNI
jgi:hypothetical protein